LPFQIAGSIIGVRLIKETFPQVGHGPRLNVDIHHGAMIEGLLTFMIVIISLGLKKKDPKSFFMKTWISTISKMTLHILGSDLTGGIMNPASVSALIFLPSNAFYRLLRTWLFHQFNTVYVKFRGYRRGYWVTSLIALNENTI